ncbi:MAG: DUF455 family protein [Planctomycetes bacterium]|nr:DUF455 family protein [Planctomycetota bacterium]
MPTALHTYVHTRRMNGIDVKTTVDLLRRYAFLERSAIPALAGWFLRAPAYETKLALGHLLWSHADRTDAIRRRLKELRGGHSEANIEPALARVGEELVHAPDVDSFVAGMRWLLEELAAAARDHLDLADRSANAGEVRLLRRLLPDLEDQLTALRAVGSKESPNARVWTKHLAALLAAAGGVSGLEPRVPHDGALPFASRFERVREMAFDERIAPSSLESYQSRMELPFEERRIAEMQIFFNEFYAAALVATILFDAWHADAPWEFFHDLSHHFWDEVRHAEFGVLRLKELGVEPSAVNLSLFDQSQDLPFLHRLCYLTLGLEVFYMPRKKPRVKRYEDAGDHRTQLFADVDWSDEGNHVQYGRRWVEHFLKDDARGVEDLQREIAAHLKEKQVHLPAGQLSPF